MNQDPEISAMASINEALSKLSEEAAARVIIWAADRYNVTQIAITKGEYNKKEEELPPDLPSLFSQANPTTKADKALVVCFWLKEMQGEKEIDAQTVNKELKNLGHGVSNITSAFKDLIDARPALAMQIRKSGKTRQARKKYKLTEEGVKRVRTMKTSEQS